MTATATAMVDSVSGFVRSEADISTRDDDYARRFTMGQLWGADISTRDDDYARRFTMGQLWGDRYGSNNLTHVSRDIRGLPTQKEQELIAQTEPTHWGSIARLFSAYLSSRVRKVIFEKFTESDFVDDPVLAKLDELATLPLGWEYGKGKPTLPHVSQTARAIYRDLFPCQLQADAFPCADGSLHLVFYAGLRSVEIYIGADKTIDLSMEEDRGGRFEELMSQEDISEHEAKNQIIYLLLLDQELFQWEPSDSFTRDTTIDEKSNLTAHALTTQAMEPAYHW